MKIETKRLTITEFDMSMAESVHRESLDEDNRRFVPDEVFETVEEAAKMVEYLIGCYTSGDGPLVYPVTLKDDTYIGYVQAVPLDDGAWEVGYHIGENYTNQGYATEAVTAFLPAIMKQIGITEMMGICLADNKASIKVMERCGFIKLYEGVGKYQGENREICKYVCFLPPKDIVTKFFEGGMVATRVLYEGVHSGTCMGIPATGKHIAFEALENFKVENGKITESWGYWPDKEIEQKLKSE